MIRCHMFTTSNIRLSHLDDVQCSAVASRRRLIITVASWRHPSFSLRLEFHLLELISSDTTTPRLDIFTIAPRYSLPLGDAVWISFRSTNFILRIPDAVGIAPQHPPTLSDALLISSGSQNFILRIPDAIMRPPSVLAMLSRHLAFISFASGAPSRRGTLYRPIFRLSLL